MASYDERELNALKSSLRDECAHLRVSIKEMRDHFPPAPVIDEDSPSGLVLQQRRLQAEIDAWKLYQQQRVPRARAGEEEGRMKLSKSTTELEAMLETVMAERKVVAKELEREQKWLEETRLLEVALQDKIKEATTNREKEEPSNRHSGAVELEKSEKVKEGLYNNLESFVAKHLSPDERTKPLTQVVKDLIARCLDSPHDPYLPLDDISEEHRWLLQRSGVIQSHPTLASQVKITAFHH